MYSLQLLSIIIITIVLGVTKCKAHNIWLGFRVRRLALHELGQYSVKFTLATPNI